MGAVRVPGAVETQGAGVSQLGRAEPFPQDLGWNEFSISLALGEELREGQRFMGKQAAQSFPIADKKMIKKGKVLHPLASGLCLSLLGWEQAGLGRVLALGFYSSYR